MFGRAHFWTRTLNMQGSYKETSLPKSGHSLLCAATVTRRVGKEHCVLITNRLSTWGFICCFFSAKLNFFSDFFFFFLTTLLLQSTSLEKKRTDFNLSSCFPLSIWSSLPRLQLQCLPVVVTPWLVTTANTQTPGAAGQHCATDFTYEGRKFD